MDSSAAYLSSLFPDLEGGGGRKGAVPNPSTLVGLVFMTATGFLLGAAGCTAGGTGLLLALVEAPIKIYVYKYVLVNYGYSPPSPPPPHMVTDNCM